MTLFFWRHNSSEQTRIRRTFLAVAVTAATALASCDSRDTTTAPANSEARPNELPGDGAPVVPPQDELAKTYATLTGLVADARTDSVWRQFSAQQGANVSVSGNRMTVNATGNRPTLILPAFCAGKRMMIEAVINSSTDTIAQLSYMTRGQSEYTESQSQSVPVKTGLNVVYFRLDVPNLIDPLRFVPGSTPGIYTLESMTARPLPDRGR